MTQNRPTYYVVGQEVQIRGVELERAEAQTGEEYIQFYIHAQFNDSDTTQRFHPSQFKVEGGYSAMVGDLKARGMLPEDF